MEIYIVRPGDTLSSIARAYGTSVQKLAFDNGVEDGRLAVGQALIILIPDSVYTVRPGDTLFSIADSFGVSVNELFRNNPYLASSPLSAGQSIVISYTQRPSTVKRINGYAYPFISIPLLRRTLPFLSTLTIFGYGFTDSGELLAPEDDELLAVADEFGVAPVLLLSSIIENGNFSSERASLLFNDLAVQNTVLQNIVNVMREKGYRGFDIDFEYVAEADKEAFIAFIANSVEIMHANGFFVNVDLAPKASADQRGLLYAAHDYPRIGALADTVFLMTYEWGYTFGPPLAVAPINQVERIVNYAVSEIPLEKILLGIPNYGYIWSLPFEKGISRAVTVGNQFAASLAASENAEILFDEASASPYFYYFSDGSDRVAWFEDVRSISAKFDLVRNFALRGFGYWNIMRPFAGNLALLSVNFVPERI